MLHGAIVGTQSPFGDGGILLTDKSYKNFELYMEVRPDYGCDSGIFVRSTESGHAYQITMDYLPGGSMGRLITETINGAGGTDRAAILAMKGHAALRHSRRRFHRHSCRRSRRRSCWRACRCSSRCSRWRSRRRPCRRASTDAGRRRHPPRDDDAERRRLRG